MRGGPEHVGEGAERQVGVGGFRAAVSNVDDPSNEICRAEASNQFAQQRTTRQISGMRQDR